MELINFILHIDQYLANAIDYLGPLSYLILFLIIFAETGLVVIPFLPGDSLLFAAGALAGDGLLNLWVVLPTLIVAAILGDTVNYWLGSRIGARVFSRENSRFFNPGHLQKTEEFYEKYGGKTIIIARFLPIIRTFAPFIAGIGTMKYRTFLAYNVIGAVIWVTSLTLVGYFFGGIPVIKDNFEYAIIGIVLLSLLPPIIEFIRHKLSPRTEKSGKTSYKDIKSTFEKDNLSE